MLSMIPSPIKKNPDPESLGSLGGLGLDFWGAICGVRGWGSRLGLGLGLEAGAGRSVNERLKFGVWVRGGEGLEVERLWTKVLVWNLGAGQRGWGLRRFISFGTGCITFLLL